MTTELSQNDNKQCIHNWWLSSNIAIVLISCKSPVFVKPSLSCGSGAPTHQNSQCGVLDLTSKSWKIFLRWYTLTRALYYGEQQWDYCTNWEHTHWAGENGTQSQVGAWPIIPVVLRGDCWLWGCLNGVGSLGTTLAIFLVNEKQKMNVYQLIHLLHNIVCTLRYASCFSWYEAVEADMNQQQTAAEAVIPRRRQLSHKKHSWLHVGVLDPNKGATVYMCIYMHVLIRIPGLQCPLLAALPDSLAAHQRKGLL